jgi:FKBP-type peptidyl-prolyl cis-trans isomerase 2
MAQITNGSSVSVNYTGRLEDGTIFDTSLHEGRTPLTAILGQGQLIPGFENGLIGC